MIYRTRERIISQDSTKALQDEAKTADNSKKSHLTTLPSHREEDKLESV